MEEILTIDDVEGLQSKILYYNKFNNANDLYCSNDLTYASIKNKIKQYVKNEKISEELANGICYFNAEDEGDFCNTLCDYFYYWIGDKIYNLSNSEDDFTTTINTIYTELRRNAKPYKCKCSSKHKTNKNFKKIKIAYEYYNDYSTLEEQLKNNNKLCDKVYYNYLNNAVETYKSVFNLYQKIQNAVLHLQTLICQKLQKALPQLQTNICLKLLRMFLFL
ncbi:hypothetical protein PVNG_05501 [Plasmodium vivax North Korean]|uniref:Uncharacterized protein n=1 Tax=Plasmodium vivax North Korean TaxID=1035514 RepID=A0A0J9U2B7_PLAVI|nr:hypothetical protein PVNG_05501 [Plasmodium vivax North Korean]